MAAKFKKASKVQWKWLGRIVEGTVEAVFLKPVTKTIKGKKITRNCSAEKPAYLVKSVSGNTALKLETELSARAKKSAAKPTMF